MGTTVASRLVQSIAVTVRTVERELLGYTLPPPVDEFESTGWRPDPPGSWCHRCGSGRPGASRTSRGCPECRGRRLPYESIVRLGPYREPLAGWLLRVKRRRWHAMAESLGDLLAVQCELAWGPSPFDVVVPIPMPWLRKTWRGIDHSAMLARRVARAFRVPVAPLLVHEGGRTQVGRSRTERLRRRCPFRIHEPTARRLERVGRMVVIDDVRSTGSTLRHAVSLLKERIAGVEVRVAVAAIAEREVRV